MAAISNLKWMFISHNLYQMNDDCNCECGLIQSRILTQTGHVFFIHKFKISNTLFVFMATSSSPTVFHF